MNKDRYIYKSCRNFLGFKIKGADFKKVLEIAEEHEISVNAAAKMLMLAGLRCEEDCRNGKMAE